MRPTRRTLLIGIGAATVLSGCIGDTDDADDEPPAADDADDTDDVDDPDDDADDSDEPDDTDDGEPDDADDAPAEATVQVASHPEYGEILVDGEELTLYMFDVDEPGAGASECYDDCAVNWPPLIAAEPSAGAGVDAELTTFERDDGEPQVAAAGWPLYHWIGDEEPGDTNGQGVNDVWWVLAPDGTPIRDEADDEPVDDADDDDPDDDGADDDY